MPKPNRGSSSESPAANEPRATEREVSRATLETVVRRRRRSFSAADKVRIVKEADSCQASGKRGELGAMLRREGIYSSQLLSWRMLLGAQGKAGLTTKKPGPKPKHTEAEKRNVELSKRNAELERKLHVANVLIALQKKAHELLGLALPESDGES